MPYAKLTEVALLERVLRKVRKTPGGCWAWAGGRTGGKPGHRVPIIMVKGKSANVRRLLYLLTDRRPRLDPKMELKATCGTSGCVNPEHMRPGKRKGGRRPSE